MKKVSIKFLRMVRTVSSENWRIDINGRAIGFLHLHFGDAIYGDLIIIKKMSKEIIDNILEEIDNKLVEPAGTRKDFIFSVFKAEEINFYSDIVDHELSSLTKKDLNEHKNLVNTVLSKYQDARGQLNEHVVREYFSKLGYEAKKADLVFDALKIDVIAENTKEIIYCQVKLGKLSERKIFEIVKTISNIKNFLHYKSPVVAIAADGFPINIEQIRRKIERELAVQTWFIFKNQIISEFPEYKRTLK